MRARQKNKRDRLWCDPEDWQRASDRVNAALPTAKEAAAALFLLANAGKKAADSLRRTIYKRKELRSEKTNQESQTSEARSRSDQASNHRRDESEED